MNRQEFTATNSYPLSTQAMALLQDSIATVAELSRIGGANYILSGCEQTGSSVNKGIIVINGEPMPFVGGVMRPTITVVETSEDVKANGTDYKNARIKRQAQFATGTSENYLPWANFKPLPTNQQLDSAIGNVNSVLTTQIMPNLIPKGTIVMWNGPIQAIPVGWALCNGNTVSGVRTPNLQGKFIVGYTPYDSDYSVIGNVGGRKRVTLTTAEMPSHNHGMPTTSTPVAQEEFGLIRRSKVGEGNTIKGGDSGDSGTEPDLTKAPNSVAIPMQGNGESFDIRPDYYTLAYIIKII